MFEDNKTVRLGSSLYFTFNITKIWAKIILKNK